MRGFRLAAAMVLLSFSIVGCSSLAVVKQTWDAAKTVVVSKNGIVVAVSLSRAAERTGTVYLKLPRCPEGVQRPTCLSMPIRETIATAMSEMRKARDALLDFVDAHPGEIGDQGLYDALKASTATLKSIFTTYNIGGAS